MLTSWGDKTTIAIVGASFGGIFFEIPGARVEVSDQQFPHPQAIPTPMLNLLPSIFVLGLAALAALALIQSRWSAPEDTEKRAAAARVMIFSVGAQSIHFAEEAATGFHQELGAFFGLPGIPFVTFVIFNVVWIGIWVASVPGLRGGRPWAFFAAWFLAIAGMVNGVAHPLLSMATGEYFPGVGSSPLVGLVSIWLWLALRSATRPKHQAAN